MSIDLYVFLDTILGVSQSPLYSISPGSSHGLSGVLGVSEMSSAYSVSES